MGPPASCRHPLIAPLTFHPTRHCWPRDTPTVQIKNQLPLRQGQAITNFDQRLMPRAMGAPSGKRIWQHELERKHFSKALHKLRSAGLLG